MFEEKKKYLNLYLLQQQKIDRLNKLCEINPEKKEEYLSEIKASVKLRTDIENKIKDIDDELLIELLFQKYVFKKSLDEIAISLNYSKRHIERLHNKALERIDIK